MMFAPSCKRLYSHSSGSPASDRWRPTRLSCGSMAGRARRAGPTFGSTRRWRLSLAGRFITGSADWPVLDGVDKPEVNRPLWETWCALFDPLNRTALVQVAIGSPFLDLALEFESGHRIDTFGNSSDGYWWYYRDRVIGEVFEVGSGGIVHDWAVVADADTGAAADCGDR